MLNNVELARPPTRQLGDSSRANSLFSNSITSSWSSLSSSSLVSSVPQQPSLISNATVQPQIQATTQQQKQKATELKLHIPTVMDTAILGTFPYEVGFFTGLPSCSPSDANGALSALSLTEMNEVHKNPFFMAAAAAAASSSSNGTSSSSGLSRHHDTMLLTPSILTPVVYLQEKQTNGSFNQFGAAAVAAARMEDQRRVINSNANRLQPQDLTSSSDSLQYHNITKTTPTIQAKSQQFQDDTKQDCNKEQSTDVLSEQALKVTSCSKDQQHPLIQATVNKSTSGYLVEQVPMHMPNMSHHFGQISDYEKHQRNIQLTTSPIALIQQQQRQQKLYNNPNLSHQPTVATSDVSGSAHPLSLFEQHQQPSYHSQKRDDPSAQYIQYYYQHKQYEQTCLASFFGEHSPQYQKYIRFQANDAPKDTFSSDFSRATLNNITSSQQNTTKQSIDVEIIPQTNLKCKNVHQPIVCQQTVIDNSIEKNTVYEPKKKSSPTIVGAESSVKKISFRKTSLRSKVKANKTVISSRRSLNEEDICENSTNCNQKDGNSSVKEKKRCGRKKKLVSAEEMQAKKMRSKERNKVAAKKCRQRRKELLDTIKIKLNRVENKNKELQIENDALKLELKVLKQQNSTVCTSTTKKD